jgi:ubiquinone/menaquinone biosynthesis C-methylase UbiE
LGEPHSASYFDEQRDFWWNRDFLRLVATRLDLGRARSVLDVGLGLGHWGRTLLAALSPEATVVGVERDPRWVTQAHEAATKLGLSDRCSFLQGVAEALPCPDQSFDLVTCQTLLIHVADPAAVIAEMQRVVAPGGTVLLSEPNNLAGMLVADSTTADEPVPELVERIEFALICERGKTAVGGQQLGRGSAARHAGSGRAERHPVDAQRQDLRAHPAIRARRSACTAEGDHR